MKGFSTRAVHGVRLKKDPHGALRMPVYDSAAFEYDSSEDLQLAFEGKKPAHSYSRISNPTVEDFEQRIRLLTGAAGVVACASGMAAIANTLLSIAQAGDEVLTTKYLFGNTYSLLEKTLKPWGLTTRYMDFDDLEAVERGMNSRTRIILFETITNPQMQVVDIRMLSAIAKKHGAVLVADGTLTTPYLCPTKELGVDIELISSTKYISGGATAIGGLVIDNGTFDWKKIPALSDWAKKAGPLALITRLRREVYRNLGACLSPHNAYLQTLGLETLSLRIDKSCANALGVAEALLRHPKVRAVHYPGLPGSKYYAIARAQFPRGCGGLLTFELESKEACFRLMDHLRLIRRATNLHDNKTLIIHPASTIFCEYSPEDKLAMGVPEGLIRLSVGIEDSEDLFEDFNRALEVV